MEIQILAPDDLTEIMAQRQAERTVDSTTVMKFGESGPEPLAYPLTPQFMEVAGVKPTWQPAPAQTLEV